MGKGRNASYAKENWTGKRGVEASGGTAVALLHHIIKYSSNVRGLSNSPVKSMRLSGLQVCARLLSSQSKANIQQPAPPSAEAWNSTQIFLCHTPPQCRFLSGIYGNAIVKVFVFMEANSWAQSYRYVALVLTSLYVWGIWIWWQAGSCSVSQSEDREAHLKQS